MDRALVGPEQRRVPSQLRHDLGQVEHAEPCGRELDRERHAVHDAAQLRNVKWIEFRRVEIASNAGRLLEEEPGALR